jgi:hypothetical protein
MKGDIIKCLNCGKTFVDTTKETDKLTEASNTYQWTGQDSRKGKFNNMCPFCYGTNTENTHEETKKKAKFIYSGNLKGGGTRKTKSKKVIKKPNLRTETIAKEILGYRQSCDVAEAKKKFAVGYDRTQPSSEESKDAFILRTGGTTVVNPVKPFTPVELMEYKLKTQHEKLLSFPDNREKYKGWRYDKRLKQ